MIPLDWEPHTLPLTVSPPAAAIYVSTYSPRVPKRGNIFLRFVGINAALYSLAAATLPRYFYRLELINAGPYTHTYMYRGEMDEN